MGFGQLLSPPDGGANRSLPLATSFSIGLGWFKLWFGYLGGGGRGLTELGSSSSFSSSWLGFAAIRGGGGFIG